MNFSDVFGGDKEQLWNYVVGGRQVVKGELGDYSDFLPQEYGVQKLYKAHIDCGHSPRESFEKTMKAWEKRNEGR